MRPDVVRGNVFVANLPTGFTDEQLAELFDPHGIVLRAFMARDPETGTTQGHGLVELAPEKNVDAAIEAVGALTPGGRRIDVRRADATMGIVLKRTQPALRPRRSPAEVEVRPLHKREVTVTRLDLSESVARLHSRSSWRT